MDKPPRSGGARHGAAAANELWPLVARLEARATDAYTLRVHGNELRKAGRVTAALVRLAHAVAIAGADQRPPALIQLACAAQVPATFDATLTELHRSRDRPASDDPLVSATAVREVHLRGLITTGRAPQAIALLSASPAPTLPTSPQWRIIEQITIAEVLLAAGDVTTGESTLHDAIGGGDRHRLPHQIQRAARVAHGHCSTVVDAASAALSRSTTPAAGYPTQG